MAYVAVQQSPNAQNDDKECKPWQGRNTVMIIQSTDWCECLFPCICETANKYEVVETEPDSMENREYLAQFAEIAGCCPKLCCQQWRPWTMRLNLPNGKNIDGTRGYFIPTQCCCPCKREEVFVTMDGQTIGRIKEPYVLCGRVRCCCPYVEMNVYDAQDNLKYMVSGSCLQPGVLCRGLCCRCCGPCKYQHYEIMDPNKEKVGRITNIYNGCVRECFTKADKYMVQFPDGASFHDKALLSFVPLMIDYDWFESTCQNPP